jgi:hypothetical protein
MARDIEHFSCVFFLGHLAFSLSKNFDQFFCPFLYWVIDFFESLAFELPVYSDY